MSYTNCGNFKTTYQEDSEIFQTRFSKFSILSFIAFLFVIPFFMGDYYLYMMNLIFIAVIGAVGLISGYRRSGLRGFTCRSLP